MRDRARPADENLGCAIKLSNKAVLLELLEYCLSWRRRRENFHFRLRFFNKNAEFLLKKLQLPRASRRELIIITRLTVSARARSAFPSETLIFKKSQKSAKKDVQNRGPRDTDATA